MSIPTYKKAKIIACSNNDFWYKDLIGKSILVKELNWYSAYLEDKQGRSILKYDVEYIK